MIVATDLSTHTQVLDAKTAILVPATPEGLAAGLVRALDDPVEAARIGRLAREKVRRDHTFEKFKEKLGEVYDFVTRR